MALDSCVKAGALLVVVTENTAHGCIELAKYLDSFSLGDIARVNHAVYASSVKEFNDASNIFQVVVRIADNTYAHSKLRI